MRQEKRGMRSAFSIIELLLTLVIMSLIYSALVYTIRDVKETRNIHKEFSDIEQFERAIKDNFLAILDAFEGHCSTVTGDGATDWGWKIAGKTDKTSVYPTYVSPKTLRYEIDFSTLSAADAGALKNRIESSFAGMCKLIVSNNTRMDFLCSKLRGLAYANGADATHGQLLGHDIDPSKVPTITIQWLRQSEIANITDINYTNQDYAFSMEEVYDYRRNVTMKRINDLRRKMRTFYTTQLSKEIKNSPPTGLNSEDDAFVPWFWEVFGDDKTKITTLCDLAGGNTCSNLNTDDIWRSGSPAFGLITRRIITNLMNGDSNYAIDGFNNQLYIYPIVSQCGSNDISTCGINAPTLPQDDYINIGKPPYTTAIFVDAFKDKTVRAPEYGRIYIAY